MENRYFQTLIESQDIILLHINDKKIKYRFLGFELIELIKSDSDILSEFFEPNFLVSLQNKINESCNKLVFEYQIKKTEHTRWIKILINKLAEKNEFLIKIEDISESKNKEENYRLIFENAVMGIYKSTPGGGRHLSVNPELARIYGYDDTEELMNSITDISNQLYVDKDRRQELLKSLSDQDSSFGFESQLYKKNGELIWISENAKAVKDDDGNVSFIVGTVKDITEKKLAEEKIRQAKEDWERTFDSIDNIVVVLDKDLQIRRMNKAAKENVNAELIVGKFNNCAELFNCGEERCFNCPAKKTSSDLKPHTEEIENLYEGKTYLTTSSPIFDDKENLKGIVFVAKDITEEKKLQQEAEYRLQQVIQADKLKSLGEVVAGVAHEINNPNAYITTNASLLEETWRDLKPLLNFALSNKKDFPKEKKYYEEIIEEAAELIFSVKDGSQRIKNVVGNLKDFARINSKGCKTEIDINEVVTKGMTIIGSKIRKMAANITTNLENNLPKLQGHFQKLEQVLINLVLNSAQAIDERSKGKIIINTKLVDRLNCLLIEISDNGSGIPEEVQSKLFDPFFTTRRDIGGSGLGLSISYDIMQEHNGILAVHSKENIGSKFSMYLPLDENNPISLKPKILCVDDEEKVPNILRISFLEESDKFFSFITEAAQITEFLSDHPEIDIILMNDKYGKFSLELIKKVRLLNPLIEIIFYGEKKDVEATEICDYYLAPFDIKKLREILNSTIRQKL